MASPKRWTDNAVLVYGPRKAGTTLFQNLLDGSPEMLVYPAELKLKYFVKHRPPANEMTTVYRRQSRIPEIASPHLSQQTYAALWRDAPPQDSLPALTRQDAEFVLASCATPPAGLHLWCAKEVGGDTGGIFALWRSMFPAGRIVLIFREPLMITRAILNDRRKKGRKLSLWQIARETWDSLRVVRAQQRELGKPGVMAIGYEQLVASTETTMKRVVDFLGVEPFADMTRPTVFGEPVVVSTASRQEAAVFAAECTWRDGLTRREQIVMSLVSTLARLPGLSADYSALRRRLAV